MKHTNSGDENMKSASVFLMILCLSACNNTVKDIPSSEIVSFTNGIIYTQSNNNVVQAMAIKGDKIIAIGSNEEIEKLGSQKIVDLEKRTVIPGMIDTHTHPGLVGSLGDPKQTTVSLPRVSTKEELLDWLREYAKTVTYKPFVFLGFWDVAMFLPDGPNKEDLDKIFPHKPVILADNSGHSFWVNSATLKYYGIDKDTPDLSKNISVFVRDENGELTGWIKEFALLPYFGKSLLSSNSEIKKRIKDFLSYLSKSGVTTIWDAGNFLGSDKIYSIVQELEQKGELPVRYEGAYHVFDPAQIDYAVQGLKDLKANYQGELLNLNTIKIHFDGMTELRTANVVDEYNVGSGFGGSLFDTNRLSAFILELEEHDIDLHLHAVGDMATRKILNAVESATNDLGTSLTIEITISHLHLVKQEDIERFAHLGVHANFTPHWFSGLVFGQAGGINLGSHRSSQQWLAKSFFSKNANVTFSSDVVSYATIERANPFVGIHTGITRQEHALGSNFSPNSPINEKLSMKEMLAGYTINGAYQLGKEKEIGSLEIGKKADFIVLQQDLFKIPVHKISNTKPIATFLNGRLINGKL